MEQQTNEQENKQQIVLDWNPSHNNRGDKIQEATVEINGFTCKLELFYDDDMIWEDGRGKFIDEWQEGAIKSPYHQDYKRITIPAYTLYGYEHGNLKDTTHFKATTYIQRDSGDKWFLPEVSLKDEIKGFVEYGASIQEARKKAVEIMRDNMSVVNDPQSANISAYGIVATVYADSIKIGDDSLWGIVIYNNDPDLEDIIDEHALEVLECALSSAQAHGKEILEQAMEQKKEGWTILSKLRNEIQTLHL